MSEHATRTLAEYVSALRFDMLPQSTVTKTKELTLDYLGALCAAYANNTPMGVELVGLLLEMGGAQQATIIGQKQKVPVLSAALGNGTLGHVVELDDGHRVARGHPGVAVLSASLPLAEHLGADGRELTTAVVAGYEVFIRLASAINPAHLDRGFHTTGTCGTVAAAAAAARLLRLEPEATTNALGLGGTQAAGLLEVTESGQMAKPMHAGKAAYGGVLAALLASRGVEGPNTIIEGVKGIGKTMTDACDYGKLLDGLGERCQIDDCYVKLYPSCRHTHPPADAMLALREHSGVRRDQVESIRITTFPTAISFAGEIFRPKNAAEAKFSIPYCACAALLYGNLSLRELEDDRLRSPDVLSLVDKVHIQSDPSFESDRPKRKGAEVSVRLHDGSEHSVRVDLPKGEQENPVSFDELVRKFCGCTARYFSEKAARRAVDTVLSMDTLDDAGDLIRCFARKAGA